MSGISESDQFLFQLRLSRFIKSKYRFFLVNKFLKQNHSETFDRDLCFSEYFEHVSNFEHSFYSKLVFIMLVVQLTTLFWYVSDF